MSNGLLSHAILAPVAAPAASAAVEFNSSRSMSRSRRSRAGVEKYCSGRKNDVIGRACTAAVEAVVEGAKVLAAADECYDRGSTFRLKCFLDDWAP